MSRRAVRQEILACLALHGPFEDRSRSATRLLREAIQYEGSEASFSQLIATMGQAGEVNRVIGGKRTYRIAAADQIAKARQADPTSSDGPRAGVGPETKDVSAVSSGHVTQSPMDTKGEASSWAQRRIARLERRIGELERDLSQANSEAKANASERDQLRLQLEHSEGNLALLTERVSHGGSREGRLTKHLEHDERALLNQLRHRNPRALPDRAG